MSGDSADKAPPGSAPGADSRNLLARILAALVLVPVAIALAWAGGWFWLGLVVLAAIGLDVEWLAIVGAAGRTRVVVVSIAALLLAATGLALGRIDLSLAVAALGIVALALMTPERRGWVVLGFCYALAALIASVLVRRDPDWGFAALMLILLVVWATDIGGYFAGRALGGPKLWARVSPKKTWAGAIGGFVASLAVAAGFAALGLGNAVALLLLAAVLSCASQLGDLFESAVKRTFGVKDSSHIIPGHGGLLDRLDGFVFAVVLGSLIGFLRHGADGVGRGLMVW